MDAKKIERAKQLAEKIERLTAELDLIQRECDHAALDSVGDMLDSTEVQCPTCFKVMKAFVLKPIF